MPTPPITEELLQAAIDAAHQYGGISAASRAIGVNRSTLNARLLRARDRGMKPSVAEFKAATAEPHVDPLPGQIKHLIKSKPGHTAETIADALDVSPKRVRAAIDLMRAQGINLHVFDGKYSLESAPAPQHALAGGLPEYRSRADDTFVFGFTSDNHLCSKYERIDVLNNLYDRFAEAKVDRVFNAGNWIDGEARFNKFDLHTHGMDRQLAYLAKEYPRRPGITTYAVAGDDHEGWYCQREGVDIGAYAAMKMQEAGRDDWVNLGYMEAFVRLVNAGSGQETKLLVCHPGGGSSYAISYTSQKSIEAFEGGEKPAVALFGHYHKLMYACIRNVHAIQTGCTEDQTPFMRKKKLSAHVGGGIVRLRQDRKTGAIVACCVEFFNYFNQDFYNDRWSMSTDVNKPVRALP
jgi:hypothetical protein